MMPAWGASERLAALVGRGRALHLLLSGQTLDADEGVRAGLIEEVVDSERFDERLAALALSIAQAPAGAVAGIKRSVGAVRSHRSPELAEATIEEFARTWTDPAHWQAVEKMEQLRRERR